MTTFHLAVIYLICFPQYQSGNPNNIKANRIPAIEPIVPLKPDLLIHGMRAYPNPKPNIFFKPTIRSVASGARG